MLLAFVLKFNPDGSDVAILLLGKDTQTESAAEHVKVRLCFIYEEI